MKRTASVLAALLALAIVPAGQAWAHDGWHHRGGYHDHDHGHVGIGFYIGPSWPWYTSPAYYPPAYYPPAYYPPVVTVPATPPVYVEQGAGTAPSGSQSTYWYYCREPAGYYPYVKACPSGWMTVVPSPPPGR